MKPSFNPLDVLKPAIRLARTNTYVGMSDQLVYEYPIEQGVITGISAGGEYVKLQTFWMFGILTHEKWYPAAAIRLVDEINIPQKKIIQ